MVPLIEVDFVQQIGDLLRFGSDESERGGGCASYGAAAQQVDASFGRVDVSARGDVGVKSGFEILQIEGEVEYIGLACSGSRSGNYGAAANRATRHQSSASRGSGHTEGSYKVPAIQCATCRDLLELPDRCRRVEDFDFITGHCVGLLTS